jgi:hypothetical protein
MACHFYLGKSPLCVNEKLNTQQMSQESLPTGILNSRQPYTKTITRQSASIPCRRLLNKNETLLAALHQIKTATSPGPYANSIDLLRSFALTAQCFSDPTKTTSTQTLPPSTPSLTF